MLRNTWQVKEKKADKKLKPRKVKNNKKGREDISVSYLQYYFNK